MLNISLSGIILCRERLLALKHKELHTIKMKSRKGIKFTGSYGISPIDYFSSSVFYYIELYIYGKMAAPPKPWENVLNRQSVGPGNSFFDQMSGFVLLISVINF